ncbi:hypothetical protein F2Q69_00063092 [Brassica cretica]|uniref:DUF4283 domain-containing protein n=1 Tax=Brassica cretica TaxID=69181 RepID=A0A8S9RH41_BRACR|nr:hypothetical protein F2Q69_00063092 [Brassica cretica]
MTNVWKTPITASAANPPSFSTGEQPPPDPFPPDPPDPQSPLSPQDYPPLSFSKTGSSTLSKKLLRNLASLPTAAIAKQQTTAVPSVSQALESSVTIPANTGSNDTVPRSGTLTFTAQKISTQAFTTIPPKSTSPVHTNKASAPHNKTTVPLLPIPSPAHETPTNPPQTPSATTPQTVPPLSAAAPVASVGPPLVERLRLAEDKTLKHLAPVSLSPSGRPRIVIPDSVFQKGAEIHKDFIVCYFNGKPPPFKQIQMVFNHMWGKGNHLEIHNNPLNRSALVRIPNAYLRQKILDKNIWYVGDSMFHTAQWSSAHSSSTPSLKAIQIWVHLTGVPLDLRHQQGLSLVAGLVGEPKETDDFTKNLVSLTLSHVKVEVDLTKPLPSIVEFERQSGEVVEVLVTYPWVPPTCSHCHEPGHIIKNCLSYTPPTVDKDAQPAAKKSHPASKPSATKCPAANYRKKPLEPQTAPPPNSSEPPPSSSTPTDNPPAVDMEIQAPSSTLSYQPPPPLPHQPLISHSPSLDLNSPDPPPQPSLKRSRSSPTFTPNHSLNPNPFAPLADLPLLKLRQEVFPLIKMSLENGESARFWHDNWTPFGSLSTFLSNSPTRFGILSKASVAWLCRNGVWRLPPARTEEQVQLHTYLTTITLTQEDDYYKWELAGKISRSFSTGEVYTYLRDDISDVTWAKTVWSPYEIPRHNFFAWLVIQNRCPTRDRLLGWGLQVPPHRITPARDWDSTVAHMIGLPRNKQRRPQTLLTLLAWKSTMYWTWMQSSQS